MLWLVTVHCDRCEHTELVNAETVPLVLRDEHFCPQCGKPTTWHHHAAFDPATVQRLRFYRWLYERGELQP
ncbi:MAG TPA: hypothetical protein VIN09_12515 [Chloroflexota bacterium]